MTGRAFPAIMSNKGARPPVGTKGAAEWYWKRYTELYPKYFWADDTKLADIVVASAKGSLLYDVEGKEYIDLTSQWATNNLGNVHPEILKATVDALERYGFLILFMNPHLPMIDLAEKLLEIRPSKNLTRVFLELSGTGAAEGAVKHAIEASGRPLILSFMGQYHGLSIGATAFGTLASRMRRNWEAFSGGAVHAPYPMTYRKPKGMTDEEFGDWCLGFLEDQILRYVAYPDRIAGAIFEPVALGAGVLMPRRYSGRELRGDPGAGLQGDRLEDGAGDPIRIGDVSEDLVLQEAEAPIAELLVGHPLRLAICHRVRRVNRASGEGLPVPPHPRCQGPKRRGSDAEPMILAHEAQDQRTAARLDRMLDGPFGGAGAGELEEHAGQVVRGTNREESLRDVDHRHVRIHEEDEETVALEGIDGRLEDLRMDVSQVVRRPLAREVDVLFAFDIVKEGALRGRDHDVGEFCVVGPEVLRVQLGVPPPVPVGRALRPDGRPCLLLCHPRRERPSGHRGFGPRVMKARSGSR